MDTNFFFINHAYFVGDLNAFLWWMSFVLVVKGLGEHHEVGQQETRCPTLGNLVSQNFTAFIGIQYVNKNSIRLNVFLPHQYLFKVARKKDSKKYFTIVFLFPLNPILLVHLGKPSPKKLTFSADMSAEAFSYHTSPPPAPPRPPSSTWV